MEQIHSQRQPLKEYLNRHVELEDIFLNPTDKSSMLTSVGANWAGLTKMEQTTI